MPKNDPASKPDDPTTLKRVLLGVIRTVHFTRGRVDLDPLTELNRAQRFLARNLRVVFLVFRIKVFAQVALHAQALTMKTILALVPLLAVVFAIFRGFGGMESLAAQMEELILTNISGSAELHETVSEYLRTFVGNIQSGKLGVLSTTILVFTVLFLLNHIESSFNTIFGVKTQRSIAIRMLTYWALLTLGPLLLGASLALTTALQTSAFGQVVSDMGGVTRLAIKATPLFVTWLAFTAMYFLVPNTRIRLMPAILSALTAGSLWNVAKAAFAFYAKNNVSYTDIYGSLAAFPMFILWIYLSWLLILWGAQLCFAFQNAATFRREDVSAHASFFSVERALCRMFLEIAREFFHNRGPSPTGELAARLGIPGRLQERVVTLLRDGGFVRETDEGGLVPAVDLEHVTVDDLLRYTYREVGTRPQLIKDPPRIALDDLFADLDAEQQRLAGKVNFRDLAARFPIEESDEEEDNVEPFAHHKTG